MAGHGDIVRYFWFDQQIRSGNYPNARKLQEYFGICDRTAKRDIEKLRGRIGAPLCYNATRKGYYYSDPSYQLTWTRISHQELLALLITGRLLACDSKTPISKDLREFSRKLLTDLGDIGIDPNVFAQCFSACWNEYIPADQEIFQQVVEALLTRRKMYIHYASPKKDYPTKRWIKPHHLQHYNGSWYLLAWCLLEDGWRKFQLCRIEKLHVGTESFNFRPEKEWAVNISGACGIFQGQKHQTVRLRFTPDRARYVREQIWCESQQMQSCEDGSLVLAFPVADFREIIMKILQHGAGVEVLEPPELRDLVQEEIAKMVKVYGKN